MQEELEVRLEEGTFSVPTDWPYAMKMDPDSVAAALSSTENCNVATTLDNTSQSSEYRPCSGYQVLKLFYF